MPGIPEEIIVHKLNINPEVKIVQQRKRTYAPERRAAAEEEVKKLLQAEFIKESQFSTWLSNVVMVQKSNNK